MKMIVRILAVFLMITAFALHAVGQIDAIADKSYRLDTLRVNSIYANINMLFSISDNENYKYVAFKFVNSARLSYLFRHTDVELSFRQILERTSKGEFNSKHYVMLSSGLYKYRPLSMFSTKVRKIYIEPLFIFQNNDDRGLHWRWQVGALVHPWSFVKPKFKMNIGVGVVRDWSSWEVNNNVEIDALPEDRRERILFVNSHIKMTDNMYQNHSEWRPMLLLNLNYRISDIVTFNLNTSFQQSLKSPYSEVICDRYPEFAKVHPYILSQFAVGVRVYKGFELKFIQDIDYENSNLSLYKSSWTYYMLFGGSWTFSNQKVSRVLIHSDM
ncbi:MAG: hypothetical protein LBR84_11585 [Tannerella sp.]|jgi:hypothetical protein|nr:hypothetical protein [Tannerella sp.]